MIEQQIPTVPQQPKKPCKNDRKTMLKKQALARMGSFNSAPKINNIDSQDDDVEIPNGLETAADLVNYCKLMRGDNRPELLQRSFFKPINDLSLNDVTDGLRYLHLNSVSKVCSSPKSLPNHIRILQWNILSQSLGQHNDNFVCCPADALTWESRKYLIVQEIIQNDPDVICLQEVDHFKFLQTILATQNYEGIFFPKPDSPCLYITENNGPDGCALFYKKTKFDLVNYDTRVLEVWRVQSNQVTITANLRIIETGKEICVCTTHLKARNGALLAKLRNEQGKDLMRFVQRVANNRPILISGDFNAEPIEPVYSTVINFTPLKLSSAYADVLASISNNSTEEKDTEHAADETNGEGVLNGDDVTNGDGITNGLKSRVDHLISHEPPYTTWKIREDGEVCHTIDYVFYSRDTLKVNNCLRFPLGNEIGKNRTPSHRYPSDHFSLLCDFEIIDSDGENNDDGDLTNSCP
ncbi:nocturnin isoform X2 [Sitodiplosis mosellana]|uniref:nocturnin isoform X2 n=1 Tax=Sitodiplosis mosellana TaxID=263140 RepID=UPI0024448884|nr:nocturnin isoform X2 [Sitodiplosis mosellana]